MKGGRDVLPRDRFPGLETLDKGKSLLRFYSKSGFLCGWLHHPCKKPDSPFFAQLAVPGAASPVPETAGLLVLVRMMKLSGLKQGPWIKAKACCAFIRNRVFVRMASSSAQKIRFAFLCSTSGSRSRFTGSGNRRAPCFSPDDEAIRTKTRTLDKGKSLLRFYSKSGFLCGWLHHPCKKPDSPFFAQLAVPGAASPVPETAGLLVLVRMMKLSGLKQGPWIKAKACCAFIRNRVFCADGFIIRAKNQIRLSLLN